MALTFTPIEQAQLGNRKLWVGTIAFDDSYPEGGYDLKPVETGRHIVMAIVQFEYPTIFDHANQKLLVYVTQDDAAAIENTTADALEGLTAYAAILME